MIRELYEHGMSISEISRRLHIDRKTAGNNKGNKKYGCNRHILIIIENVTDGPSPDGEDSTHT